MIGISLGLGLGRAAGGPALSLDFLPGSLDARVTFTRGSTGTYFNSSGVLSSAAINTPRFDYDPVTLAAKGLLIEEARTNLLTYSSDWTNAAWTKSRATVTTNATAAPDGTSDADKLVEDTTASATHRVFQQAAKAASSLTRTFSVYLKAAERTFARVSVSDNTETVVARADVNLSTGTITAASVVGGSTISAASSNITPAGNGWYRCSITATFDATITNPGAFVFICDALASISYTGNGTSGLFIWGAQWEDGAFATSYIPTVASTVTRSADVATMTGTNFSSWYNQSEGTFVAAFDRFGFDSSAGSVLLAQADDGTTNNRVALRLNARLSDAAAQATIVNGGSVIVNAHAGALTSMVDRNVRAAMAYQVGTPAVGRDGSVADVAAAASLPTVNQLTIGQGPGASAVNGHIRSVTYYNTRLPNAQLQALTA